jgi:hypothetical protein
MPLSRACGVFDEEDHPVAALAFERIGTDEARSEPMVV